MGSKRQVGLLFAAFVVFVFAVACSTEGPTGSATSSRAGQIGGFTAAPFDGSYRATIRRTTGGVPHIAGANLESVTFGQGYASGEDYACTLADQILKITGRRAEFLGPGDGDANIKSDFAWRAIGIDAIARKDYANASAGVKALMAAFVAGWNKQLIDTGADHVKGWCRAAPWLVPLTAEDVYAYARSVALNASSTAVAQYVGGAQPPGQAGSADTTATARPASFGADPSTGPMLASNGWAIGADRSAGGGGMLLANPHFPWEGELRFWEVQLTIPGQLDIYGVQLAGLPGVGIGFTSEFAWTHTVSAGHRFTAYSLDLQPGNPTSYRYDGQTHDMTSRVETIKVKQANGTTSEQQRRLWFSEYGPILDFPGVGWTTTTTLTYRDANIGNTAFIDQYLAMDSAKSFDEFKKAHETYQGVPLFNTIAVSKDGRAWYADTSATPELSQQALSDWDAAKRAGGIAKVAADNGVVLLDGSKSSNQWIVEPGARSPGLVPYARMPQTERKDYVFNANDSFWLNHAGTALEGDYSPMHGDQRTVRSLRTRENATVLGDTSATGPSGPDAKFSIDELRNAALQNRGYSSRTLKDAVVARCKPVTTVDVPALPATDGSIALPAASVDISAACHAIEAWDGTYNLDSRGAHVWRELMVRFEQADFRDAGHLFATPFDPADPVGTPNGLAPPPAAGPDPVLVNLGQATQVLAKAGVPVDATLGEVQRADRNGTLVPIHGGIAQDGTTNVVSYASSFGSSEPFPKRGPTFAPRSALSADGYRVNTGTSFLLTVELTGNGPNAFAFLTYGETEDRSSPNYLEPTQRFSNKDWRRVAFNDSAITSDPNIQTKTVSS